MALSSDLISQFAKLTDNTKKEDTGAEVKGTFVTIGGVEYVRLDGSEILTPVSTAVEAVADERVVVLIKDHMAEVIKNITSPAARNKSVSDIKDEVDEFGNTIQQMDNTIIQQGNSIIQMDNAINQQGNTINQHDTLINQQGDTIVSLNNTIIQQGNQISSINNTVVEQGNNIVSINNTVNQQGDNINSMNNVIQQQGNTISQQGNTISQQGNQITQFGNEITQMGDEITSQNNKIVEIGNTVQSYDNQFIEMGNTVASYDNTIKEQGNQITSLGNIVYVQNSDIKILNSGFKIIDGKLTGLSDIIVDRLKTDELDAVYADIDFTNISIAAVEKLFVESGIIKDLVVQEGHITGELVGVTIKGDLIEGNTIKADKLVVKGEDGLYYKLNVNGETVETEQTNQNSLSGTVITAKSITASKITVDDLVAFGATIAGFIINKNSIHSDTKGSIDSNAKGIYMDKDGQFYLGDSTDHVKYYKDQNGKFVLDIRANQIFLGTSDNTLGDELVSIGSELTSINTELETQDIATEELRQALDETNASLELTSTSLTTKIESYNESALQTADELKEANDLADNRYKETKSALSQVQQQTTQITNIFQLTGGSNLIQNSVWYYQTSNIPHDWLISPGTIISGGQDDDLIGLSVSRGRIKIKNGSVQTANGNIINILTDRQMAISFMYKNGANANSKVELFAGVDTSTPPIWSRDLSKNTNDNWETIHEYIVSTVSVYVIKITSNTSSGTGDLEITDLMFNYGEIKPWELGAGEVFGSTIKLSNKGIQITSDTANTEAYFTTDGINVFNKKTGERITKLTDDGTDTKNLYVDDTIKQKKMINTIITDSSNNDIYIEYIED